MTFFRRLTVALIVCICAASTGLLAMAGCSQYIFAAAAVFIAVNVFPSFIKRYGFKKRMLSDGADLLAAFVFSIVPLSAYTLIAGLTFMKSPYIWISLAVSAAAEFIIFWNGIIRVYCTSSQLGIKWRLLGILCGMIPFANIIVLIKIIRLADFETTAAAAARLRDEKRKDERVCATKYPILLVHGVFFRDTHYFNYWGRIPSALQRNGATVIYGNQQSALSVKDSAAEIAEKIKDIVDSTGCGKVNIIAHSKGGLDCRYAITHLGADKYTASLTTVNTPHRGCLFADWLLDTVSPKFRNSVAGAYNAALCKFGESSPDFIGAVNDLRTAACQQLNETTPDMPNVLYSSIGGRINKPFRGVFPLNLSYAFVKHFDGPNDGLVSEVSAKWGEEFTLLTSNSPEGVSHADVIDLARKDKPDLDICEFYVGLVHKLKEKEL